ncbi:unnamed protein product [Didymodactylos carnosus]|uniref:K Homology domain-containing protein n=2 Tax=Didymodactylos carnosus TaxID=1234261 RepID=A0A814ADQ8_9BILA|nr:unnamed protein product [Didymodactylos carnosus]CAF3693532.1 unnamed protein product [Didymodactylos carnosus]
MSSSTATKDDQQQMLNGNSQNNENILHVKFLLPGATTGSVIGKGGERIASLQKETSTKMKMSKAGDYFPGTQERVCLVVGSIPNVLSVYDFVGDKIKESFPDVLRSRQIKLVIPNATAGVIIGKGGQTIENIKQDTGASLNITPKCDMAERVMTIIGDEITRRKTLEVVLSKILQDPHHDSVPSVNYSSSFASQLNSNQNDPSTESFTGPSGINAKMGALMSASSNITSSAGANGGTSAGAIQHISALSNHSLQSLGFPDQHAADIVQAIGTLINFGLITINMATTANPFSSPLLQSPQQLFSQTQLQGYATNIQRDRNDGYSVDMDFKRFKPDQRKAKR